MTDILSDQQAGTAARSQTHALFAQTTGYVAFIAAFGAAGYATRRHLIALARVCFWVLLALIVAGIVLIFVHIPGTDLAYSVLGLIIFAGFTMFDSSGCGPTPTSPPRRCWPPRSFSTSSTSSWSSCRSSPTRSGNSHGRVEPGFHRRAHRHPAGPGHWDSAALHRGQRHRSGVLIRPATGPDTAALADFLK